MLGSLKLVNKSFLGLKEWVYIAFGSYKLVVQYNFTGAYFWTGGQTQA